MLFLWENTFHGRQPEGNLATQAHGPCSYSKLPSELWEQTHLNSGHSTQSWGSPSPRPSAIPHPQQAPIRPIRNIPKSINQELKTWGVTGYSNPQHAWIILQTRRSHPTSSYDIKSGPRSGSQTQGFSEPFPERVVSNGSKEADLFWTLFGGLALVLKLF